MAGHSLSGSSLEATPHVRGVGNAPVLWVYEGVVDVVGASRVHLGPAHTRAAECMLNLVLVWVTEGNPCLAPIRRTLPHQANLQSGF